MRLYEGVLDSDYLSFSNQGGHGIIQPNVYPLNYSEPIK